ncbi:MAG TPA: hypothetical protein VF251_05200 [Pyrinomonadaceae bacterium]
MTNNRLRLFASLFLFTLLVSAQYAGPTAKADHAPEVVTSRESCASTLSPFITWFPEEVTCPICQTKQIFMVPGSWGSYIYQFPSKYQLIYWPHTDSPSWHSCKKCRYTAFMGDFKEIPKDKISAVSEMLKTVSLPEQKEVPAKEREWNQPYMTIPSSDRLLVAEKVYRTLGRPDAFWAHFYRVLGYHMQADKKPTEAAEARRKALAILEGWLSKPENAGTRKELLYVCGAMHHFLKEDVEAMKLFTEATTLTYKDPGIKAEDNEGYNGYLSNLIKEYIEMLKKGEGPRDKKDGDH